MGLPTHFMLGCSGCLVFGVLLLDGIARRVGRGPFLVSVSVSLAASVPPANQQLTSQPIQYNTNSLINQAHA